VRDLNLFEQYLLQLRQQKLQESHATLIAELNDDAIRRARTLAYEADLIQQLITALRALNNDPGQFIKEFLR
jgi:hypothetical protein